MFQGPLQPVHLLVVLVICLLLFGKRLPDVARYLGKRLIEFKKGLRKLERSIREDTPECNKDWRGRNDEEPGASPARLEPPDKPRPPAQVALTPSEIVRRLGGPGARNSCKICEPSPRASVYLMAEEKSMAWGKVLGRLTNS